MTRWFSALLASALALSVAPAAPASKAKAKGPGLYHLTAVGTRWVYQSPRGEMTFVVSKVEKEAGAVVVDVAVVTDGREVPSQQVRVSAEGVFRLSVKGTKFPSPECLLKLPHKDGQAWEVDLGPLHGGPAKLTAVRRETVETPAGTFDCIRVERTGGNAATYWFAEGVGLVKEVDGKWEDVLKSFTPGKD